jgi:hypothetical protein
MKRVFEACSKEDLVIVLEEFKNNHYVDRSSGIRKKKKQLGEEAYFVYVVTVYHRGKKDGRRRVSCLNVNPHNGFKCRREYGHTGKHCIQRDYSEW